MRKGEFFMKKRYWDFSTVLGVILAFLLIIPIMREPYLTDNGYKSLKNYSEQHISETSNSKSKKKKR